MILGNFRISYVYLRLIEIHVLRDTLCRAARAIMKNTEVFRIDWYDIKQHYDDGRLRGGVCLEKLIWKKSKMNFKEAKHKM